MLVLLFRKLLIGIPRKQGFNMNKKQIISIVIVLAVIAASVYFLIRDEKQEPVINTNQTNIQQTNEPIKQGLDNIPDETDNAIKPDEVTKDGNLVTYNNPSIGIEFVYNSQVYSKPNVLSEQDAKAQGYNKDLKGNVLIFPDISLGENPGTAVGSITVYKVPGYQNYIDDEKQRILDEGFCKILSEDRIAGAPALKYTCSELGDGITVIIKTSSHHIHIQGLFPGQPFEDVLKSIKLLK